MISCAGLIKLNDCDVKVTFTQQKMSETMKEKQVLKLEDALTYSRIVMLFLLSDSEL